MAAGALGRYKWHWVKDISLEKIFNFLKEINILEKIKFEIVFSCLFSPFKHGFKIVYRLILRHTHYQQFNIQYEMCIALI